MQDLELRHALACIAVPHVVEPANWARVQVGDEKRSGVRRVVEAAEERVSKACTVRERGDGNARGLANDEAHGLPRLGSAEPRAEPRRIGVKRCRSEPKWLDVGAAAERYRVSFVGRTLQVLE